MRVLIPVLLALVLALMSPARALPFETVSSSGTSAPQTIVYRGDVYVGLSALQENFGMESDPPKVAAQIVRLSVDGQEWDFLNGGDRTRLPDDSVRPLIQPLLIVDGTVYLDQRDASVLLGVEVSTTNIMFKGKQTPANAVPVVSKYEHHTAEALTCASFALKLTDEVEARANLHPGGKPVRLPSGSLYLCRRKVTVDGMPYLILTDAGNDPVTFLVKEEGLKGKFAEASLAGSAWQKRIAWFQEQAPGGQALRHGERTGLSKSIGVTVDLCWSLRPMEENFLTNLPAMRPQSGGAPVTIFASGRWIEQHPADMETLVGLEQEHGEKLIWGLHSWIHPKKDGFMDDLSVPEVREDTLRLERKLLEWGIVPTVYYRFPGLIHDPVRLAAILDMDLLPIDCEAWVAVQGENHPFGKPIQDGSIVLVHGNGNEPSGIARFQAWLMEHPDWKWESLPEFLPSTGGATNQ